MRSAFKLVRHGFELASAVALLLQLGVAALGAVAVAAALDLPWPLRAAAFLGVLLVLASVLLAAYGTWLDRSSPALTAKPERVGIKNRAGGRSHSKGATFGADLDTAIDNSEGGESTDEDSTFN